VAPRPVPAPPVSTTSRSSTPPAPSWPTHSAASSARIPLEGAADHGVSQALYLRDPDGNGVELYWDRPPAGWPRTPEGDLAMVTQPLDLEELLAQAA
jgi:catechol-2,3-dioxygenase